MKKLLFAVTTDLNYDQRMQRICSSLARNGYQVILVGRAWEQSEPLQAKPYRQHRLRCFFNKGKLFYVEFSVRLFFYLLRRRFDAYCAIDLDTVLPVFFNAKLAQKPFIYDAHEYFPEVIEVANRKFIKKIWLGIEQFIVTRTSFAYTVTQSIADLFKEKYGTHFSVIRNISAYQPFVPAPKPVKYILYQGAVNEGRGIEQLLEAMPLINTELVICGRGDLFDAMVAKSRELGIQHKVHFKGYVLPDELQTITRGAWLGYNLLENKGLSYYFSLANKFFDYIHAGIPQLCVAFPEYTHLNKEFEVAVMTELTPEAIAAAVNKLLNEPALYNKLAANCEKARHQLNWQHEEQKLLDFYQNIWTNP